LRASASTDGVAVGRANARLEKRGLPALPDKLTPHSLRRTFCSLLSCSRTVMAEMGHTDPAPALKVYDQVDRLSDDERKALCVLIEGASWPMTAGFWSMVASRANRRLWRGAEISV
jgi:integrase